MLVYPSDGIGTGLAKLDQTAPKIYERIKKMEDLIEKKKAAGEKILFALNTDGLSESEITEEASALEEEEAEEEGEDEDDEDY